MAEKSKKVPGWAWALGTLLVVVLACLVYLMIPSKDDDSPTTQESSTASPSPSIAEGSCGAGSSADETVMDSAPSDTQWETTTDGWTGPVSNAGPKNGGDQGVHTCFEHSAEGALNSATWAYIELNNPSTMKETLDQRVVDSPAKDAALKSSDELSGQVQNIKGYRFLNYSEDKATVRLLVQLAGESKTVSITLPMVWADGDWKVRLPDTGDMQINTDPTESDFLEWSA